MAAAVIAAARASPALADDLVGAYVGAGVGLGRVEAGTAGLTFSRVNFDESHFAYHLQFGIHPTSTPLALELEYVDLGQPDLRFSQQQLTGTVSQRGGGLFLLYYVPIPIVQAYVKAGGSRVTTRVDFSYCGNVPAGSNGSGCITPTSNSTNNAFAFGGGLQWTLGRWAVRGEYERFNAGGGHPSLITVGVDWTFL